MAKLCLSFCLLVLLTFQLPIVAQPNAKTEQNNQGRATTPSENSSNAAIQYKVTYKTSATAKPLPDFLSGVKFAYIDLSAEDQQIVDTQGSVFISEFSQYLRSLGFEAVVATSQEKQALLAKTPSLCDLVKVKVQVRTDKVYYTDHLVEFRSCLNDVYLFTSPDILYRDELLIDKFYTLWHTMYNEPIAYQPQKRLALPRNMSAWDSEKLHGYFDSGHALADNFEGIYERVMTSPSGDPNQYQIGIKRNSDKNYDLIYLGGAVNKQDWMVGEKMGEALAGGSLNFYKVHWRRFDKSVDKNVYIRIDEKNMMNLAFGESGTTFNFYKQYPLIINTTDGRGSVKATGTGVAISANGYLVTNYHVVQGANNIEVSAKINGKIKVFNAKVAIQDKTNDLAILQIEDFRFKGLPEIPYTLKTSISSKGDEVYTLGYPLAGSMGEGEVKFAGGNISALRGYKEDVATYQMTVPVHPGNSGGPLFDSNANLVGIVKAKHSKAESATYAIKTRYVLNLIELLSDKIVLPTQNKLGSKAINKQVYQLEPFVFFVKVR